LQSNEENLMFSSIENNSWSNKFSIENNDLVDAVLNSKYLDYINNTSLAYKKTKSSLAELLLDPVHADYQSMLLSKYFKEPQKYLKLDCDYLSILVDSSKASYVEKLSDKDYGLEYFKTNALKGVMRVDKELDVGKANNGLKEDVDHRFTSVYRIFLFNDRRKYLYIYLADGTEGQKGNKKIQIDFIPNRFTSFELNIIFGHIRSTLKNRPYEQFIKKAMYQRVDVAFNLPGVFQPFIVPAYRWISGTSSSSCLPAGELVETTYIGHRRANHYIIYDKILKETKTEIKHASVSWRDVPSILSKTALTTRIERRFYTKRATDKRKIYKIIELSKQEMPLDKISIVDPAVFPSLLKKHIKKILLDKRRSKENDPESSHTSELCANLSEVNLFRLDPQRYEKMKTKLLSDLVKTIAKANQLSRPELESLGKQYALRQLQIDSRTQLPIPFKEYSNSSVAYKSEAKDVVVQAGAGCGKTYEIVKRVVWLIKEKNVLPSEITVLAYTNKAAEELTSRIKELLGKKTNLPNISTFTAWCGRQLKMHYSSQFEKFTYIPPEKEKEKGSKVTRKAILKSIIKEHGIKADVEQLDSLFAMSANECKPDLHKLIAAKKLSIKSKEAIKVRALYNKYKSSKQLWDFDDVLTKMNKALKVPKFQRVLSLQCKHFILDEMQDSNLSQWNIVLKLSDNGVSTFCVGDVAQSIFGFRGANPVRLKKFIEKQNAKTFVLGHCYRSSSQLLRVSNFVRLHIDCTPEILNTSNEPGILPELINNEGLNDLVGGLRHKLSELLGQGLEYESIVILARTKKVVVKINSALKETCDLYFPDIPKDHKFAMTMHKAKGLEYDICIVIDPRFSRSKYDTRDEYLRLIYVAVTRAKKHLIICRKDTQTNAYRSGDEDDVDILDSIKENKYLYSKDEKRS
jgi:DNA helicase-2/ATP-dependent DNA helicase PcrA